MAKTSETDRLKIRSLRTEAEEERATGALAVRICQMTQTGAALIRRGLDDDIPKFAGYRVDRGVAAIGSVAVNVFAESPLILALGGGALTGWAQS